MGFFDLKFVIIIFLIITVYMMYREIINIKYKVNNLYNLYTNKHTKKIKNNNSNIIDNFIDSNFINSNLDESNLNESNLNESNFIDSNLDESNLNESNFIDTFNLLNNNNDDCFINKCIIKTIKIPLDLNSFLGSFENNNVPNTIINLSSSNIEEIDSTNIEEIDSTNNEEIDSTNNEEID